MTIVQSCSIAGPTEQELFKNKVHVAIKLGTYPALTTPAVIRQ